MFWTLSWRRASATSTCFIERTTWLPLVGTPHPPSPCGFKAFRRYNIEFYRAKRNQSEVGSVEEGREESLISNTDCSKHTDLGRRISKLLCEFPGGNQVDGLPPAAHTGAGVIGQRVALDKCGGTHPISGSSSGSLWFIAVRL